MERTYVIDGKNVTLTVSPTPHAIEVRLLENSSHGETGTVVALSTSVALDLIAAGKAVEAAASQTVTFSADASEGGLNFGFADNYGDPVSIITD